MNYITRCVPLLFVIMLFVSACQISTTPSLTSPSNSLNIAPAPPSISVPVLKMNQTYFELDEYPVMGYEGNYVVDGLKVSGVNNMVFSTIELPEGSQLLGIIAGHTYFWQPDENIIYRQWIANDSEAEVVVLITDSLLVSRVLCESEYGLIFSAIPRGDNQQNDAVFCARDGQIKLLFKANVVWAGVKEDYLYWLEGPDDRPEELKNNFKKYSFSTQLVTSIFDTGMAYGFAWDVDENGNESFVSASTRYFTSHSICLRSTPRRDDSGKIIEGGSLVRIDLIQGMEEELAPGIQVKASGDYNGSPFIFREVGSERLIAYERESFPLTYLSSGAVVDAWQTNGWLFYSTPEGNIFSLPNLYYVKSADGLKSIAQQAELCVEGIEKFFTQRGERGIIYYSRSGDDAGLYSADLVKKYEDGQGPRFLSEEVCLYKGLVQDYNIYMGIVVPADRESGYIEVYKQSIMTP